MFRKLITDLPFQPSLLSNIAQYAYTLRSEVKLRKLGLIIVILGMLLQSYFFLFPVTHSLVPDTSNLVYGAKSRQDIISAYTNNIDANNRSDIQAIYNYYGIGNQQIEDAEPTEIQDNDDGLLLVNRNAIAGVSTFVSIPSSIDGGIYEVPFKSWANNGFPTNYPALTGVSEFGYRFWLLLNGSGNIVLEKGNKQANLEIKKQPTSSLDASLQTYSYDVLYRNSGEYPAYDVVITETLPEGVELVSYTANSSLDFDRRDQKLIWQLSETHGSLQPSYTWSIITITVRGEAKDKCTGSTVLSASNAPITQTDKTACIYEIPKTCPGTGLPIPPDGIENCTVECSDGTIKMYTEKCSIPVSACSNINVTNTSVWNKKRLNATVISQPDAPKSSVTYYVNNSNVGVVNTSNSTNTSLLHTFESPGNYTIKAVLANDSGSALPSTCSTTLTISNPNEKKEIISSTLRVSNQTQNIQDANNKIANPGDMLVFSLSFTNKGIAVSSITSSSKFTHDIKDIVEYADIIDLGDSTYNDKTGKLQWSEFVINPEETVTKQFTVRIKDPLPSTPIAASNPLTYDFQIQNQFGNSVYINLNTPISKQVEISLSRTPELDPIFILIFNILLLFGGSYFYIRSKMLSKELRIIQTEFQTGGL